MGTHEVFVYGTLLRGESNHHRLAGSTFLGNDSLCYTVLFDQGMYPILRPGSGIVFGERWSVSTATLSDLDQLEGHPVWYQRVFETLDSGAQAWVYLGSESMVRGLSVIPDGNWKTRHAPEAGGMRHRVFMYGSNLLAEQLAERCPEWNHVFMVARLDEHELRFNKKLSDGFCAANVVPKIGCQVWGAVVELTVGDLMRMDQWEGCPGHYVRRRVTVVRAEGESIRSFVYLANPKQVVRYQEEEGPSDSYLKRILNGARNCRLPESYRDEISQRAKS